MENKKEEIKKEIRKKNIFYNQKESDRLSKAVFTISEDVDLSEYPIWYRYIKQNNYGRFN
jgi:hypothetical protein